MRKLILALVLVLAAGLCFAQEEETAQEGTAQEGTTQEAESEKFNMEILVGVLVHSIKSPTPHEFLGSNATDKTVTSNTTLGFAMTFAVHKFVGLTLDADLFFGGEVGGQSSPQSSSVSLFGANVLFGPSFYLYKYRTFRIPLALGAHMFYWDSTAWMPTLNTAGAPGSGWLRLNDLQVGLGLSVGIHFYFTHNAYMISRANVSADFFRWHKTRLSNGATTVDESETEFAVGWGIRPTIGLGLKF